MDLQTLMALAGHGGLPGNGLPQSSPMGGSSPYSGGGLPGNGLPQSSPMMPGPSTWQSPGQMSGGMGLPGNGLPSASPFGGGLPGNGLPSSSPMGGGMPGPSPWQSALSGMPGNGLPQSNPLQSQSGMGRGFLGGYGGGGMGWAQPGQMNPNRGFAGTPRPQQGWGQMGPTLAQMYGGGRRF